MRTAEVTRKTAETDIRLTLELDGSGNRQIDTGIGFLNHMLELFAAHGGFDLTLHCAGDLHVDGHHTTEDVAIALGRAFDMALGDRRGIHRYGDIILPMDEALVLCAVDISGRSCLGYEMQIPAQKVGDFDTELVQEFMTAFCRSMGLTLHLRKLAGYNSHHIIEAAFKALGRALRQAVAVEGDAIPSTKGTIV